MWVAVALAAAAGAGAGVSVSAASVIAKVARDAQMAQFHESHPVYRWDRNKGYASAEHREAIRGHGLSPLHRASWAIADAPTLF